MMRSLFNIFRFFTVGHHVQRYMDKQHRLKMEQLHNNAAAPNAVFSESSVILNFLNDKNKIVIGDGTQMRANLMIYPYGGQIDIGANCFIGDDTRIWSADHISIGNDVQISHNVTIIDSDSHEIDAALRKETAGAILQKGFHALKSAPNIKTAPIIIEDDVWISFNAVILKGVIIGKRSIVAAGAVVIKDVPPDTIVAGNPARVINNLNA